MSEKLTRTSQQYLQIAVGWLELGNYQEAAAELQKIHPSLQMHPLVLRARWSICAVAKRWHAALEISRTMAELQPNRADTWILHANTLCFAGHLELAYQLTREKMRRFRCNWEMHYHFARYACRLGKIDEAESALACAIELGNPDEQRDIKWRAWQDSDLRPLWLRSTKLAQTALSSIEAG